MLTITVNADKSLLVTSDDENAENATVADLLHEAGETWLEDGWNLEPFVDGELVYHVTPEYAHRFLEAIEQEFAGQVDEASAKLKPHVGGGPKKGS